MNVWKAVAGVTLVFLLGVAAGGLGVYSFHRHRVDRFFRGEPGAVSGFLVHRLSRDLGLDAPQKTRVEAIVGRSEEEMRALRQQFRPQFEEILAKGRREVRAELRADQQRRFDAMTAERGMRRRWRR
jgi:hypothetical protein